MSGIFTARHYEVLPPELAHFICRSSLTTCSDIISLLIVISNTSVCEDNSIIINKLILFNTCMRGMITKERNATYNMGGQAKKKKKSRSSQKGRLSIQKENLTKQ